MSRCLCVSSRTAGSALESERRLRSHPLPKLPRRHTGPVPECADKALLVAKTRGGRHLLHGFGAAVEQCLGAFAAHLVLQRLQARALVAQLAGAACAALCPC